MLVQVFHSLAPLVDVVPSTRSLHRVIATTVKAGFGDAMTGQPTGPWFESILAPTCSSVQRCCSLERGNRELSTLQSRAGEVYRIQQGKPFDFALRKASDVRFSTQ